MVAAVVLMSAGLMLPATSPASAATPVFIQTVGFYDCLDQHYNSANQPTTTVYGWKNPCHYQGNQQWQFEHVSGTANSYRIVNHRSTFSGARWCLSHPNPGYTRVYAEFCLNALQYPKQLWTPLPTDRGNKLFNESTKLCLWSQFEDLTVWGGSCEMDPFRNIWRWNTVPVGP